MATLKLKRHGHYDVQELIPLLKEVGYKGDIIRTLDPKSNGSLTGIILAEVEKQPVWYDDDMIDLVKHLRLIGIKSKEIEISVWW